MATAMAAPVASDSATTGKRVTKRRIETRERLLTAALDVFAEEGLGRSTVEQICEHAGYTRGAFYSNFASLDELFLAMWQQRSERLLNDIGGALQKIADGPRPEIVDLEQTTRQIVDAIPLDDKWYRITAEFTAHALRNPSLKTVMTAREDAIRDAIVPIVIAALSEVERRVPDPHALGRALVAVHDGTMVQCLMEPGDPTVLDERARLFTNVVRSYSEPK